MADTNTDKAYENFDLRAKDEAARDPQVKFAFEHPELLERFQQYDRAAMDAKKHSRWIGFLAVALVLIALVVASAAPVLKGLDHHTHELIGYCAAGLGLLGALLGFSGFRKSSSRNIWLRNRLRSEILRLFHFRYLAARLPEIATVGDSEEARNAYLSERAAALDRLDASVLKDPKAELARIVAAGPLPDLDIGIEEAAVTGAEDPQVVTKVLAAWRALRLDWQLGYCEAKLARHSSAGRMSSLQTERAFSFFAWTAVAVIATLHLVHFGAEALHLPLVWIEVIVVWTALAALAARALEDGLKPQREVERYEQYRANILVARERLNGATDFASRLEIVRSFERISLEEMRVFIRTHATSKFLV